MEEPERRILKYNVESERAREILSRMHAISIEPIEIQTALCITLEIDELYPEQLLERELTEAQITDLLRQFDFNRFRPELLMEIELEESIIPDGTCHHLAEKTIKVNGEVWRIHKSDADPWPSNPHAHNYDAGLTLHLGTGELFLTSNRKSAGGKIKRKDLLALRKKAGEIHLPELVD